MNMSGLKKFWRCHVCNDIHYSLAGPVLCPTCAAKNAYVLITPDEVAKISSIINMAGKEEKATRKELKKVWESFTRDNEFMLNPDNEKVDLLSKGVLENERNHDLRYCPCRLALGDFEKDLELICPCNFIAQSTYEEKGECWCGLFIKR
jgi:ferredoxin-thioredoxin reductase catalytic subunit